jgi:cellulose synthase/poly-beta-1,6-N-acetylglucosamine synthase-like glycosyltransferase
MVKGYSHSRLLKYVKQARAQTDVPDKLPELTSQRRRWLNGSFFAAVYALVNFRKIYSSPHSRKQKILFTFEFAYNLFNLYFTWFSIANFYLSFYFLFEKLTVDADSSVDPFYPNGFAVFGGNFAYTKCSFKRSVCGKYCGNVYNRSW